MQGQYRSQGARRIRIAPKQGWALTLALALVASVVPQLFFMAPAVAATCTGGTINIIAHQDDDLLFQSPDLLNDIAAGRCVRSLFVTAGDAGMNNGLWQDRELGAQAAHAYMAGVPNFWTSSTLSAAGKTLTVRTLKNANISLVFLRVPDGMPLGSGSDTYGYQSVKRLLDGAISSVTTVDNANTFTATTLRNAVLDVIRLSNATTVRTQDYVSGYGVTAGGWTDHFDHQSAAYVAKDASDAYSLPHRTAAYMGYPVTAQSVNVSGTLLSRKTTAFYTYCNFDPYANMDKENYVARGWINHQIVMNSYGATVVAYAGANQSVNVGSTVTLDASGSAASGSMTYVWTQLNGAPVTLSSTTSATPTFVPSASGSYTFQVKVSSGGSSSTSQVTVSASSSTSYNVATASGVTVTASSQSGGQPATNVVDGDYSGYPADSTKEWATAGQGAGAWVKLTWPQPVFIDHAALYDRPNTDDQVTSGVLTFSDGSTVNVGALDNLGGATSVSFPPRATSSIQFTVKSVSSTTHNVGLSEFEAFGAPDKKPVADAGANQSVTAGSVVTLDGSASSDPDQGTTLTYAWAQTSGPAATLSATNVAKPTFTPTAAGSYVFQLTVSDGALTATASVTVTVAAAVNQPPVAHAGVAQSVETGVAVTLDGSASSDPDPNTTLTYAWAQTSGPTVALSATNVAKPTFTPSAAGTYGFQLTVSDGSLTSTAAATVTVTLPGANRPPVAQAGPAQSVATGVVVTLDGSASSDPDPGTTLTYAWTQTAGSPVVLSAATVAKPTFTAGATGQYTFQLAVSDGSLSSTATVTITVTPPYVAPTANAGPDLSAAPDTTITLDGSGSVNPNAGMTPTYAWVQTSGPATSLSDAAAVAPTINPTAAGTYVFQLTVGVGGLTSTDSVTVVINAPQDTNVARVSGVTVTASSQNPGTAQTAAKAVDGSPLGYPSDATKEWSTVGGKSGSWIQLSWAAPVTLSRVVLYDRPNTSDQVTSGTLVFSDGTSVPVTSLNNAGGATTFNFSARTVTSVRLNITGVSSTTSNVGLAEVEAWGYSGGSGVNRAPVAKVGPDQTVVAGTVVTLDGSGSTDPDANTTLSYAWTKTSGPSATLTGASSAKPSFTPATAGTYEFALVVSDGVLSSTASMKVVVAPRPNQAPVAVVNATQSAVVNAAVTLDGSRSTDPEGNALTYQWTQTAGPAVTVNNASSAIATATMATAGSYVFTLQVTDTGGLTATTSTTVTVTAVPPTLTNLARVSGVTVTASSQNPGTAQTAAKAVDGSPLGYPSDATKEWSTVGGKSGSWIQLSWAAPVTLSRVVLYDRPNTSDQVTSGTLVFSDGTSVPVTSLNNAGGATTFNFSARTVTSVRLNITAVSSATSNVGLAEFEAWGSGA